MELAVKEVRQETPSVISLVFDKPTGFVFQPGQFMTWEFPVEYCDKRCNRRPFSLASSPTEDFLMLTTRLGESALKKTLKNIKKGSTIKAIGPLGEFVLDKSNRPAVMLAGGIGITPLRSIIKYAIDKKISRQITLLYSNKTPNEIVYRKELDKWNKEHDQITVVYAITGYFDDASDSSGVTEWTPPRWHVEEKHLVRYRVGRINKKIIKEYVKDLKSTHFYTCGPPKMVKTMENILKNLEVDSERIHVERFEGY